MNEKAFWDPVGIDPHELANTLFGLWSDYDADTATERATSRILSGLASADRLPTRDA